MKNVACSWSGGKDCCMALLEAKAMGYNPVVLLNMMHEDGKTSRSHSLPVKMLRQQAKAMNINIVTIPTSRDHYEINFIHALKQLKNEFNIEGIVYGDIDLVAHRDWQERVCKIVELEAILPLWERKRITLAHEIVDAGIESIIVAANSVMGERFLGETYSSKMIDELQEIGVDSCGEDGEFHSFVVNSPLHKNKVQIPDCPRKFKDDFHFIDWQTI
ncbi:MAG: diphthine--ammonia ligase [Paludibacter sp.]|nr:diphthine--ammonia ligase [Paludibacter sp.]